jgi:hypothetical protein
MASITVDGQRASARSFCLVFVKLRDGSDRQVVGEYTDELASVDDGWVFTHRHYQVLMTPSPLVIQRTGPDG